MTLTTRRSTRAAVFAAVAATAVATGLLAPGSASAAPGTAGDAATAVADTGRQLGALTEQLNDAQLVVDEKEAAALAAAGTADAARAELQTLRPRLVAIAQAGFLGGSRSGLEAMLTSDSADDLVQQLTTLDQLAGHTDTVVARVAAAEAAATQAQATAAAAEAEALAAVTALEQQQAQLEQELNGYQERYAELSAEQQSQVTTALVGPAVSDAQTDAAAAAAPAAAPTEAAAAAVEAALAQVGDPYVIAGSGPDGFDCSGLTQYAYAAAGVSLPHSSRTQSTMGAAVARADLQPGDLVFFYSPVSHVGMYIGNGMMVHASVSGRPVAVTSVDKPGYVNARRPTA